jgi:hypothetical protein
MNNNSLSEVPLTQKLYDLYKVFHILVLKFPKTERYSLGQTIDNRLLELIELISLAGVAEPQTKGALLKKAAAKLDLIKLLIRLSHETNSLSEKHYLQLQEQLQEIGKMLGGWIRYTKQ